MQAIDVNRGVMMMRHRASGMQVFMYMDEPGYFYDAHGNKVNDKMAKEAGFDTYELAKKRMLKEKMAEAYDRIAAELETSIAGEKKVLKERGGYRLVEETLGRASIEDADGNMLTDHPKALAEAKIIFDTLAGEEDDSQDDEPDKTKEKPPAAKAAYKAK